VGGEPALLASCVCLSRGGIAPCDLVVFLEPMKAVVIRNTILILDSGCKGWGLGGAAGQFAPDDPRQQGLIA
jgi:hypothetical protein